MFAQAMVERGMLESVSLGISSLATGVGNVVQAQPYLTIFVAVVLGFLLIRRR